MLLFISEALLSTATLAHLHTLHGSFCAKVAELSIATGAAGLQGLKHLLFGLLQKKFADSILEDWP